jgi:hypothetical protein
MKFHATINGKPSSISVDDVLIDYLGAWYLDQRQEVTTNAKSHYESCKKVIKILINSPELPSKNISQFVQSEIIKMIAAPHLESIIAARGPRYVPPKRLADSASKLPPLTPAQQAIVAERKHQKALFKEAKKQRKSREAMKQALKNSIGQ